MTIKERLENMERELGRVKRRNNLLLGAILILVGGLTAAGVFRTKVTPAQTQGAGTANVIHARSIFTKSIFIDDEKGVTRATLNLDIAGPSLMLCDETGRGRVIMAVIAGTPWLSLSDEKGVTRALLRVGSEGPTLELHDENGKIRFSAGKTKLLSPDGKIIEYPESSLILFGPDGKVIWSAIR